MDLTLCPHCGTRVVASSDGECPSCRRPLDAAADAAVKGEAPWAAELPPPLSEADPELVTVARFDDPVEASLAKNCLEDAGFGEYLTDAETVSVAWQLSNALGGIKLQVAAPDAARAWAVLRDQRHVSAADREELAQEATATAPGDDDPDEPEPEPTPRERDAERAFRGAVFGLLFFPLEFYATYLLLKVLFSSHPLLGRARGRAFVAAAINGTYLSALCLMGYSLIPL